MNLAEEFDKLRTLRDNLQGKVELLSTEIERDKRAIEGAKSELEVSEEVVDLLTKYASLKEDEIKTKIDRVITKGLRAIFPDEDFESRLDFTVKRGQAVAEPKLITGELETNIVDADSGGVANVVGFLYQLLVLALRKPRQRQIIFADEPFKNLSEEYLEATGEFIRTLTDRLGMQVVLITHQHELKSVADIVYRFTKVDNRTEVAIESGGLDRPQG